MLKSLAGEVLPTYRGEAPEVWMGAWSWSPFLPDTPLLYGEVERTLLTADDTLRLPDPRWAFEWVFEMTRLHPPTPLGDSPALSLDLALPPVPLPNAPVATWHWWENEAVKNARSRIHELSLLLRGHWGAYLGWERLKEERSSLRRHLHWLAIKQAQGDSYPQVARRVTLSGEYPERGVTAGGIRRGVLKAAEEIGLHPSRIRQRRGQ